MLEDVGVGRRVQALQGPFKKTWGENVVGQVGLGIIGFLAVLPGLLVIALGVATGSVVVAVVIGAIGVAWIIVASTVVAALSGIYRTALYWFASTGHACPATSRASTSRPRSGLVASTRGACSAAATGASTPTEAHDRSIPYCDVMAPLIEIDALPQLRDPVMVIVLSGWVDAGMAGAGAMAVLTEQLESKQTFGRVDLSDLLDLQQTRPTVRLADGADA